MRTLIGQVVLALGLSVAPSVTAAQDAMEKAKHEFGADIAVLYEHQSGIVGTNQVLVGTPVDLRLGFIAGAKLVVEPRIVLSYHSQGGVDSVGNAIAAYVFTPDLNVLWALGDNKRGPYLTGGTGVDLEKRTEKSTSQFSINVGVGTRAPYESGAIRVETFGRYAFRNKTGSPGTLDIGARIGVSLWH